MQDPASTVGVKLVFKGVRMGVDSLMVLLLQSYTSDRWVTLPTVRRPESYVPASNMPVARHVLDSLLGIERKKKVSRRM